MANAVADRIEAGTVIAGTYELTAVIGEGGSGIVWAARHLRLPGKQVAIKILLRNGPLSPDAHARFRHEAEIVSRLRHPNIVDVLDFNELSNGTPYMVLELLHGQSLRERLERSPLPLDTTLAIVHQIGAALKAAHAQHIVHRDLKPENIFLCDDGGSTDHVKVLDFGISKMRGSDTVHTQNDVLVGTPRYMSPEQALGKNNLVDHRTDQFALAAIVYEMLSGRAAFAGTTFTDILMRVVHDSPTPLSQLVPDAPPNVLVSVPRALDKDPDRRFPDVAGFVGALSGRTLVPVSAPPAPPLTGSGAAPALPPSLHQPARDGLNTLSRRSRRLAVLALSVVAICAVPAWWFWHQPPPDLRTIAVMEFENQRPDDAGNNWYCKALQTAFNTELNRIPQLSVVAPELIQRTAKEA